MSLQVKYSPVLALMKDLNIQGISVTEEAGKLKIGGTANSPYEKNVVWDKIKEVGGEAYSDIAADIRVANKDFYHIHTVQSGESLSKISKHYYRDANKYMLIFNANQDQLKDPNLIKVGQKLKIPNL